MNDYLLNLSARSFDLSENIPLVSPRLPSLFEPSQETRGASLAASSWTAVDNESDEGRQTPSSPKTGEEPGQGEQVQHTPYDTSRKSGTKTDKDPYLPQHPVEAAPGIAERDLSDNEQAVAVPAREGPVNTPTFCVSEKSSVSNVPEPALRFEMQMQEKPAERTPVKNERQMIDRPRKKDRPVPVQEGRMKWPARPMIRPRKNQVLDHSPLLTEQGKGIADPDVSSEAAAREQEKVISPPIAQPFQRPIEPMLRPWRNPGHREDPVKPEPTIQVTIGRIEVRAAPPAARNRPKPKGPAPMGLDEYLRGRYGGGR